MARHRSKTALATMLLLGALLVGLLVAPSSSIAFTGHHCKIKNCRYFTSSYHTAIYFYNRKTCDQWKGLSKEYLHGFRSKAALKRRFDRKLHSPCWGGVRMGFRARKSIKLGPGVRLNASKTGLGLSVGNKGGRYSVHSSGRRTASASLPGTGLGYTKTTSSKSRSSRQAQAAPAAPPSPPKPGMLAPADEKAFAKGINLYVAGNAEAALPHFMDAAYKDTKDASTADDLFAGLLSAQLAKVSRRSRTSSASCDLRLSFPTISCRSTCPAAGSSSASHRTST